MFWSLRLICVGTLLAIIYIYLRAVEKTGFTELGFKKVKSLKYALVGVVLWFLIYSMARLVLRAVYPPAETILEIERYPSFGYLIALVAYFGLVFIGLFDVGFCVGYLQNHLTDKLGMSTRSSIAISSLFYSVLITYPYMSSVFEYSLFNMIGYISFNTVLMAFLGYFYHLAKKNLTGPLFAYAGINLLFAPPLEAGEISPFVYYLILTSILSAGIIVLMFISIYTNVFKD